MFPTDITDCSYVVVTNPAQKKVTNQSFSSECPNLHLHFHCGDTSRKVDCINLNRLCLIRYINRTSARFVPDKFSNAATGCCSPQATLHIPAQHNNSQEKVSRHYDKGENTTLHTGTSAAGKSCVESAEIRASRPNLTSQETNNSSKVTKPSSNTRSLEAAKIPPYQHQAAKPSPRAKLCPRHSMATISESSILEANIDISSTNHASISHQEWRTAGKVQSRWV